MWPALSNVYKSLSPEAVVVIQRRGLPDRPPARDACFGRHVRMSARGGAQWA
jgi:hypothetical protein